jgi:hypothetical protein
VTGNRLQIQKEELALFWNLPTDGAQYISGRAY